MNENLTLTFRCNFPRKGLISPFVSFLKAADGGGEMRASWRRWEFTLSPRFSLHPVLHSDQGPLATEILTRRKCPK